MPALSYKPGRVSTLAAILSIRVGELTAFQMPASVTLPRPLRVIMGLKNPYDENKNTFNNCYIRLHCCSFCGNGIVRPERQIFR